MAVEPNECNQPNFSKTTGSLRLGQMLFTDKMSAALEWERKRKRTKSAESVVSIVERRCRPRKLCMGETKLQVIEIEAPLPEDLCRRSTSSSSSAA